MRVLLKNGNLITLESHYALDNTDLLIQDGKIKRIGKNITIQSDKIIDCTGKYLMPGLWDGHAHLLYDEFYEQYILAGVTSVRDLFGTDEERIRDAEVRSGSRVGPYSYSTSPIIDGPGLLPQAIIVKSPEEAIAALDAQIEKGYTQIKLYPSMDRETFIALANYAKERNVKIMGHMAINLTGREQADLGYYCAEHVSVLPLDLDDVEYCARSGMWLDVTHYVVEQCICNHFCKQVPINNARYYDYCSKALIEEWEEGFDLLKANPKFKTYDQELINIIERGRVFMRNSSKIISGTDSGNPGVPGGFPVHDELVSLTEIYGMSRLEAIKAMSANCAEMVGISDEKGMLKERMDSDIIILNKNPLEDIRNTRTIDMVIQGTKIYDRAELDKIEKKLKENSKDS